MKGYVMLALGILSEALATVFLKNALGFTVLVPSLICIVLYGACNFFIAQSVQSLKVSIAYATWYGAGIVAAAGLSGGFIWLGLRRDCGHNHRIGPCQLK